MPTVAHVTPQSVPARQSADRSRTTSTHRLLVRSLVPSPALGAGLAAFIATLAAPNNPDTLWHMAVGRWILEHRALPDISRFYYSATAGYGYDYSWLSQVVLYSIHRFLGGVGVAVLASSVAAFVFYLLYKLLEENEPNMLVNIAVLCVGLLATAGCLSGRPLMFSVLFFTLDVFVLARFTLPGGSRVRTRTGRGGFIWLIPVTTALWANLHPGFVLAPLLVAMFLPLAREFRDRRTLALCLAATVLAVMSNPFGWRLYLMPLATAQSMSMLRGLSEWTSVSGWEAVVWGGLVALVAVGLSVRRQPLPLVLIGALAALGAGVSNRNMPLFGVIAVFLLGRTLVPALAPLVRRSGFVRRFDARFEAAGGWLWAVVLPVFIVGAAHLRLLPMELDFDFSRYPVAAVRCIQDRNCPGRVFVRETWSGYLLWAMPDHQLFYDAKGGFSRQAAADHAELAKAGPGWRDAAERNGLSTFLLERGSPLAVVLAEAVDWHRAHADSLAEVFVRAPGTRLVMSDE